MINKNKKRVLIVMKNGGFFRYFGSTILEISKEASVYVGFEDLSGADNDGSITEMQTQLPDLKTFIFPRRNILLSKFFSFLGLVQDQIRFLHPIFDEAYGLWSSRTGILKITEKLNSVLRIIPAPLRLVFVRLSQFLFRKIQLLRPVNLNTQSYLIDIDPDVIVFTGLVWPGSTQSEILFAAQSLKIPTTYYVNSWDNLSNKGDIKVIPGTILVWNDHQKREVYEIQGIKSTNVHVIGAGLFDKWFEFSKQNFDKINFLNQLGLNDCDFIILYMGSSSRICKHEDKVFENWISELKNSKRLKGKKVGVILRSHPANHFTPSIESNEEFKIKVYPERTQWVVSSASQKDLYSCIVSADAVVGLNTSAILEASIFGKPVLSWSDKLSGPGTSGTVHYKYLVELGFVINSPNLKDHIDKLVEQIFNNSFKVSSESINHFLRPKGLNVNHSQFSAQLILSLAAGSNNRIRFQQLIPQNNKIYDWLFSYPTLLLSLAIYPIIKAFHIAYQLMRRLAVRYIGYPILWFVNIILKPRAFQATKVALYNSKRLKVLAQSERIDAMNDYILGARNFEVKNLYLAHFYFNKCVQKDPNNLEAVHLFCDISSRLGRLDCISKYYQSLIDHPSYNAYGKRFKKLVEENPPISQVNVFRSFMENNEFKKGIKLEHFDCYETELLESIRNANEVFIGPWMSEVGYETLYWIPFVRGIIKASGVDRNKVHVISRGGVKSWYSDFAGSYYEIFDYINEDQYKKIVLRRKASTSKQKQYYFIDAEKTLVKQIIPKDMDKNNLILHPKFMFKHLIPCWKGLSSGSDILNFKPVIKAKTNFSSRFNLPDKYFAVKFYFRESFPDTEKNRKLVQQVLSMLVKKLPVVNLETGMVLDDHLDFNISSEKSVFDLKKFLTASNNLEIQSEAIQNSEAYIGTYGGLVYQSTQLGVPSFSFESNWESNRPIHTAIASSFLDNELGLMQILRGSEDLSVLENFLNQYENADSIKLEQSILI